MEEVQGETEEEELDEMWIIARESIVEIANAAVDKARSSWHFGESFSERNVGPIVDEYLARHG